MDLNIIMLIVWLSVFVVALLVEIFTEALVSCWFCIGAVLALCVTFIPGMPYWGEIILFAVGSLLSFLIIRPLVYKNFHRIKSDTNIDAILSRKGVVTKRITSLERGEVRIDSVYWTAIKRDLDADIEKGEIVEVVSVVGNKLLVKKTEKKG